VDEHIPPLSEEEEQRYLLESKNDGPDAELARTYLLQTNKGYICKVAKKYLGRGLEWDDLIQEGNMGLLKAIENYDPKKINEETGKPFRFLTYAGWWIRQFMARAIQIHGRTVRLPAHKIEAMSNMSSIEQSLRQELRGEPTRQQVADRLGVSEGEVCNLLNNRKRPRSLEEPASGDDERDLHEKISTSQDITLDLDLANLRAILLEATESLNEREKDIVLRLSGLNGEEEQTLVEIGLIYDLSRERIRQINEMALKVMREYLTAKYPDLGPAYLKLM
jgi:RNA polymerase primary sigma factor